MYCTASSPILLFLFTANDPPIFLKRILEGPRMRDQFNYFFDGKSSSFAENVQMSYLDVFTNCTLRKTISFFLTFSDILCNFVFLRTATYPRGIK